MLSHQDINVPANDSSLGYPETTIVSASRRRRYSMFGMIFLLYAISYADRAGLSIAVPALGKEFDLSAVQLGWISSSFLWSYFILNLPSSILLDMVGPRVMGTVAVAFWSAAMMCGGFVSNISQFVVTRIFLGVGESPTFGIGNTLLRRWATHSERGIISTLLITGQQTGLGIGTIAGAFLISHYGWRNEFFVPGLVGLLWACVWCMFYRQPSQGSVARKSEGIAFRKILILFRSKTFYGILIPQCMGNYFYFLVISWLPVYFIHRFHQTTLNSGTSSALGYGAAAVGAIVLGGVLELLLSPSKRPSKSRRYIVFLCMGLASSVGLLPLIDNASIALVVLTICMAGMIAGSGANTALLAEMVDDGSRIGTVTGTNLTFSNVCGLLAPILTGYILSNTGRFDAAWYICSVALIIAGFASLTLVDKPIRTIR